MKITRIDTGFIYKNNNFVSFNDVDNDISIAFKEMDNNADFKIKKDNFYVFKDLDLPDINGAIVRIDKVLIAKDDAATLQDTVKIDVEAGDIIVKCHTVAIRKHQHHVPEMNIATEGLNTLVPLK